MKQHLDIIKDVLEHGHRVKGRNGYTLELFGKSAVYRNVGDSFPIITTKKMAFKVILAELICFIRGYSDVRDFQKMGCKIWNANAYSDYWKANPFYTPHSLGRIYGVQWRDWRSYSLSVDDKQSIGRQSLDQLTKLVQGLKSDPHGRRHIVTAWNPGEICEMSLPPCHILFQCNVTPDKQLNLMMYQRSCDLFLGNPFDISSYCALMLILCHQTGLTPGNFIHHMGSVHVYEEHLDVIAKQVTHTPLPLPKVVLKDRKQSSFEDYEISDFIFERPYNSYPALPAAMVV